MTTFLTALAVTYQCVSFSPSTQMRFYAYGDSTFWAQEDAHAECQEAWNDCIDLGCTVWPGEEHIK